MIHGPSTVSALRRLFHEKLRYLYELPEINSIIYILFGEFLGWPRTRLHLEPDAVIEGKDAVKFYSALDKLAEGCPVQYVTGLAEFNEFRFRVNPGVLIPRPETAELAALIVSEVRNNKTGFVSALDIGTGSGCIAVYLKKHLPHIKMQAIDISPDALSTARFNASLNETEIEFSRADILDASLPKRFEGLGLIVSNPPYVTMKEKSLMKPNVKDYEPSIALFVPDSDPLLFYRAIVSFASVSLSSDGLLYLEINEAFGPEIRQLLEVSGFYDVRLMADFRGRDRFAAARLRTH